MIPEYIDMLAKREADDAYAELAYLGCKTALSLTASVSVFVREVIQRTANPRVYE
jgi:hypothetical protein